MIGKAAEYRNDQGQAITIRIGERPGEPPVEWKCEPGAIVTGPANYRERFQRGGLTFVRELARAGAPPSETGDAFGLLRAARETVQQMQQELEATRRKANNLESEKTELQARLAAAEGEIAAIKANATTTAEAAKAEKKPGK